MMSPPKLSHNLCLQRAIPTASSLYPPVPSPQPSSLHPVAILIFPKYKLGIILQLLLKALQWLATAFDIQTQIPSLACRPCTVSPDQLSSLTPQLSTLHLLQSSHHGLLPVLPTKHAPSHPMAFVYTIPVPIPSTFPHLFTPQISVQIPFFMDHFLLSLTAWVRAPCLFYSRTPVCDYTSIT